MSLVHTNFRANIPVGIDWETAYREVIKYVYIRHLKFNTPLLVLTRPRTHPASISGLSSLFLRQFWNL